MKLTLTAFNLMAAQRVAAVEFPALQTPSVFQSAIETALATLARHAPDLAAGKTLMGWDYDLGEQAGGEVEIASLATLAAWKEEKAPAVAPYPFTIDSAALEVTLSRKASEDIRAIKTQFSFVSGVNDAIKVALQCQERLATASTSRVGVQETFTR